MQPPSPIFPQAGNHSALPAPSISPAAAEAARVRELGPVRVLVVSPHGEWRDAARHALTNAAMTVCAATTLSAATQRIGLWSQAGRESGPHGPDAAFDVALVDAELPDGSGLDLGDIARSGGIALLIVGREIQVDDAVAAMRAGAADIVEMQTPHAELAQRVLAAAAKVREHRRQRGRIVKLKRMCRRLNSAREQVARQVDVLCTDLVEAYQELAEHMNQVTTATEFKGLIKGELDIESLLRTTLEFVLSRSGPTNAAIFLPTTSGDYSLGAYVNYDCPKDTVDILLDQLANVVAPRFEQTTGLIYLDEPEDMDRYIGDDAGWLDGSGVCAMACRCEGETLAIFMLFRDRRNAYGPTLMEQVKTIGELFAAQLARVIHIHHRHLPKDKWGMLGDPEHGADGYDDLAA